MISYVTSGTVFNFICCRSLDLEAQYTINPSRAAEITIADTVPGKGSSKLGSTSNVVFFLFVQAMTCLEMSLVTLA